LEFAVERPNILPDTPDALNAFAPERDAAAPLLFAGYSTHDPLASDIPFFIDHAPVPLAPVRAAHGRVRRALTVLALLGSTGWAGYRYQSTRPLDLDAIAAWTSRLAIPTRTATTVPTSAPSKALPLDPAPVDSLPASNESAISSGADRTADTNSNTSAATMSEAAQPTAARPENAGTSAFLAIPVQNVSGTWRLDTQTEASDSSLKGLTLHYEIELAQDGNRVTGAGTKVSEIGKTAVTMSGTIAGKRLTMDVVETGARSGARSKIVLLVDNAETLRGRFSSSAAPSSGHVEARRISP